MISPVHVCWVATGNDFFKIFKKFQKYHQVVAISFLITNVFEFLKNIDFWRFYGIFCKMAKTQIFSKNGIKRHLQYLGLESTYRQIFFF